MRDLSWLNNLHEPALPIRIPKVRLQEHPDLEPKGKRVIPQIASIEVVTRLDATNMPTFLPEQEVRGIDVLEVSFKRTADFPTDEALKTLAATLDALLPLNPLLILFLQPSEDNAYTTARLAVPREEGVALGMEGDWQGAVGVDAFLAQALSLPLGISAWHQALYNALAHRNDLQALRKSIQQLKARLTKAKGFAEQQAIRAQLIAKEAELSTLSN